MNKIQSLSHIHLPLLFYILFFTPTFLTYCFSQYAGVFGMIVSIYSAYKVDLLISGR
jgi:hypothetical protein